MADIIYITNRAEIPSERGWNDKSDFKRKNQNVLVTKSDNGEVRTYTYILEAKKTTNFPFLERIFRIFLGCSATLFSLGFGLFSKSVRRLITKSTKASKIFALPRNPAVPPASSAAPLASSTATTSNPNSASLNPAASTSSSTNVSISVVLQSPSVSQTNSSEPGPVINFYTLAEQFSFWDSYLNRYLRTISSPKWNNRKAWSFLNDELQGIKGTLEKLKSDVHKALKEGETKRDSASEKAYAPMLGLEDTIEATMITIEKAQILLQNKIEQAPKPKTPLTVSIQGISNATNTCYINSALQPLLATGIFPDLVPTTALLPPGHSPEELPLRQAILDALNDFLHAWRVRASPQKLGEMVAGLRIEIFIAGLAEGGFINKNELESVNDARCFFELILSVIGRGFNKEFTRTPVMDDGKKVLNEFKTVQMTQEGVFPLKGSGGNLQNIVNEYRNAIAIKLEYNAEHLVTGERIHVSDCREMEKIVGPAPEILVLNVGRHVVHAEEDKTINFEALFKNPPPDSTYELVGFSQNYNQVHWTACVWNGSKWIYCNDSIVRDVSPQDEAFTLPANYMVYKKKRV